eukprot:m.55326 g.55326  ORF g.55326 m.55326 type:complete len:73 (-) comp10978_c0_seq2:2216-2434(-)
MLKETIIGALQTPIIDTIDTIDTFKLSYHQGRTLLFPAASTSSEPRTGKHAACFSSLPIDSMNSFADGGISY